MSGVRLSRHHLPTMKQKNWRRILFISSESAVQIPAEVSLRHDQDSSAGDEAAVRVEGGVVPSIG